MADHVNFYENIKEAKMRLQWTTVLYDGEPYQVVAISNYKDDGIFRVYLEPIGSLGGGIQNHSNPCDYPDPDCGLAMDEFMKKRPQHGIIRKMMNSPAFNKFRPFPMGMINYKGHVNYLERHPQRQTYQGLTSQMLLGTPVSLLKAEKRTPYGPTINMMSSEFRDCILGKYPTLKDCLVNLRDPDVVNDGAAFHRNFAVILGPVNTMFLAYKGDIIGHLPNGDVDKVRIDAKFVHTREVVSELGLFGNIVVN